MSYNLVNPEENESESSSSSETGNINENTEAGGPENLREIPLYIRALGIKPYQANINDGSAKQTSKDAPKQTLPTRRMAYLLSDSRKVVKPTVTRPPISQAAVSAPAFRPSDIQGSLPRTSATQPSPDPPKPEEQVAKRTRGRPKGSVSKPLPAPTPGMYSYLDGSTIAKRLKTRRDRERVNYDIGDETVGNLESDSESNGSSTEANETDLPHKTPRYKSITKNIARDMVPESQYGSPGDSTPGRSEMNRPLIAETTESILVEGSPPVDTSEDSTEERSEFEARRSPPPVTGGREPISRVEQSLVDDHTYFWDNQMFEVLEPTPLTEAES